MACEESPIVNRLARILALVITVMVTAPAMGQGAGGVPNPLSLRETMEILSRYTTLQPDMRVASEAAHDRYLESFERLREGEIQKFLDMTRDVEGGRSGTMPTIEQIDDLLEAWESVRKRVAVLDAGLFDEIAAALDEEHADAIARVRRIRDRQRHFQANSMVMRGSSGGIDLAFWQIEPTEEERLLVDDVLRGFEAAMPRLSEALSKASVGMVRELTLQMADRGLADLTQVEMQDPEVMRQVMETMFEAQRTAMLPTVEARSAIEDRELAAAKGFRSRLAPDRWYRMKRIWASEAFPGAGLGLVAPAAMDVPKHAEEVRSILDGDSDREQAVDAILRDWYASEDRITDDLIDLGRQSTVEGMLEPMAMGPSPTDADLREKHEKRRETAKRSIAALLDLLPDQDARAAIEKRLARGGSAILQGGMVSPTQPIPAASEGGIGLGLAKTTKRMSNIPNPILKGDLELFAWLLNLDPSETLVIETLHQDYLESWSKRIGPLLEKVGKIRIYGHQGGPLAERIVAWGKANVEALQAILRLDAEFLDEIMVMVGDDSRIEAGDAMRVQRIFDRIESIADIRLDGLYGLPVIEPASPYRLLREMDLDAASSERCRRAVIGRNADVRSAVEGWEIDRLESDVEMKLASAPLETAIEAFTAADEAEEMAAAIALSEQHFSKMVETASRRRLEAEDRRGIVRDVVLESVVPELSPLAGIEIQVKLFDRGWSGVGDSGEGLGVAAGVLRLTDLDADQISMLETLFADHLRLENELIDDMSDQITNDDGQKSDLMSRVREISEKFAFRRGELQERLLQRMLVILRPEQIERLPGLSARGD